MINKFIYSNYKFFSFFCEINLHFFLLDCKSPGYPCFKNPYAMDFNESMVTACKYVVDCPADLILALFKVSFFYQHAVHITDNENSQVNFGVFQSFIVFLMKVFVE